MPGDSGHHLEHEARAHSHPHEEASKVHDKTVSTHGHAQGPALIHSLSPNDWHHRPEVARAPAQAEGAHLPRTEITDVHSEAHKIAPAIKVAHVIKDASAIKLAPANQDAPSIKEIERRALQHDVMDHTKNANERLGAAHKLAAGRNTDIIESDGQGKPLHLHIAETKDGSNTHIMISQVEGLTARPYLEGTLGANGKVLTAMSASPPTEFISPKASNHLDCSQPIAGHVEKHNQSTPPQGHPEQQPEGHQKGHHHQAHEGNGTGHTGVHHHKQHTYHPDAQRAESADSNNLAQYHGQQQSHEAPQYQELPQDPSAPVLPPSDLNGRFQQAQSQTGGVSDKMVKLPDGSVYMRTHLMVDADGGTEWQTDRTGQANTSLRNADGRSLNAKAVNYFVLPLGAEWKHMGIKLGDVAWVRNIANGTMVPAIFGDEGPHNKIGEGSQALCRALGLSDNPSHGGTSQKNIEFLIVPHSGTGKGDIAKDPTKMVALLNNQPASGYVG